MKKISDKQNLINQLDAVRSMLIGEKRAEVKLLVEGMFCLQSMINSWLVKSVCRKKVFWILQKEKDGG